jgi:basic amino acid/polyamine antiporter, APA family
VNSNTYLEHVLKRSREQDSAYTLQRTLTSPQLVALGIGATVGAGIFVATGIVAAQHTGPAIVLSFLVAAVACLCAGFCYAELAAMVPVSGSAYSYVYASFGPTVAWLIGWCLTLEYLMAAANVAVGWAGYFCALAQSIGIPISPRIAAPPFAVIVGSGLVKTSSFLNAPAIGILTALTLLLLRGVRLSVQMNAFLVAIKLAVILLFIICGAFFIHPANWHPFLPNNTGIFGEFGWSGVLQGAGMVFYAYLGFDTVSTAARETHNPQRSMPIGIIGSLVLTTVVYIAFSFVLTGLAPYRALAVASPVSAALDHAGPSLRFLKVAVEIGAVVGLTSVVLVLLFGQSRILFAMAQDGLVPAVFGKVGAHSKAPYAALFMCGSMATFAAGFLPVDVLGELVSIGTLFAFMFVCSSVLFLRLTKPNLPRPFRTPAAPLVCVFGILICGYLIFGLPHATWWRFLLWLALGGAIYLIYGHRKAGAVLRDSK